MIAWTSAIIIEVGGSVIHFEVNAKIDWMWSVRWGGGRAGEGKEGREKLSITPFLPEYLEIWSCLLVRCGKLRGAGYRGKIWYSILDIRFKMAVTHPSGDVK